MPLAGTKWLLTEADGVEWRIAFLPHGSFLYTDPVIMGWDHWRTHPWCNNGRWSLQGASVLLRFEGAHLEYRGFLSGTRIEGVSRYAASEDAPVEKAVWSAVLESGTVDSPG